MYYTQKLLCSLKSKNSKKERNSLTANNICSYDIKVCCTAKIVRYRIFFTIQILQLLLLQCETLQICKCRYIHTYHFESLAMKKVKTLVKLPFTCTPNQCTRFYTTKETHHKLYLLFTHQKHHPVLLCFDLNYL